MVYNMGISSMKILSLLLVPFCQLHFTKLDYFVIKFAVNTYFSYFFVNLFGQYIYNTYLCSAN